MSEAVQEKLFGMEPEKGRWMLVILGMVINLCLGSIYSWSVFVGPLTNYFTKDLGQVVSASEILLPFSVFLAFFAIAMPFAGKYIEKYGPRNMTIVGGCLTGLGWLLSSFAGSVQWLYLFYGVIAGIGVGIALWSPCCRCSPLVPRSPWTGGWTDPARVWILCGSDCQYCRIPHRSNRGHEHLQDVWYSIYPPDRCARTAPEIPRNRVEACRMDTSCAGSRSGSHLRIQTRADA